MKKILGIIVLGLLLSTSANASQVKVMFKDESRIHVLVKHGSGSTVSGALKLAYPFAENHCKSHGKFYGEMGMRFFKNPMDKRYKSLNQKHYGRTFEFLCFTSNDNIPTPTDHKSNLISTNYDASSYNQSNSTNTSSSKSSSISTNDKITQSKQICKDLGFKTNTEKFADCALKMMSIQFEATNKVASSSGGTKQEIIVKHKNDYDVFDAMIDMSNALLSNGNNSSSSSSSNNNTKCVIGRTNPTFGTTTMNCN